MQLQFDRIQVVSYSVNILYGWEMMHFVTVNDKPFLLFNWRRIMGVCLSLKDKKKILRPLLLLF